MNQNEQARAMNLPSINRLAELSKDESVTGLIYGNSKSSKTWFLGTGGDRVLFVDTGEGLKTLHSPLFKKLVGSNPLVTSVREKMGDRRLPFFSKAGEEQIV